MKKTRRILALIITAAMLVSALGLTAFADEPEGLSEAEIAVLGGGAGGAGSGASGVTSSADLTDFSSVRNKDAVSMMVKLGLINGTPNGDGTYAYAPDANIERAAVAKIVALAVTLASGENIPAAAATFSDSDMWAKDFIEYCASKGIINGKGAGSFDPEGTTTGVEFAKLLLAACGADGLTGADWAESAASMAEEMGLLEGMTADLDQPITRDDAALMLYNALTLSDGSSQMPQLIVIAESTETGTCELPKNAVVTAPEGKMVTLTVDGVETGIAAGKTYENAKFTVTDYIGQIGSFNGGDANDYDFRAGLYVNETGIVESMSVQDAIVGGEYDEKGATGITMTSDSDNFNGIIVDGGVEYTIKDSTFRFLSPSDGSAVNDFSGYGAVISAFNGAKVVLDSVDIETKGVARLSLFADEYANALITNSKVKVMGGTLYSGYINSADQATMVAPPWVLGITGNARGTNLEGNLSSTVVYNSDIKANQWGVLSTDAGKDMQLIVIDSTLTLLGEGQKDPMSPNWGSGYGTYIIGDAQEYFYGVTMNVGTYAGILTGGDAWYGASEKGKDYAVYPMVRVPNGTQVTDFMGNVSEGYDITYDTSNPIFTGLTGLGNKTVLNSDAFGFMAHNTGSLTLDEGTEVNTGSAIFLMKAGNVVMNALGGAVLNPADGVLVQVIDNDDALVGVHPDGMAAGFNKEFNEPTGYAGIDYEVEVTTDGRNTYTFNAEEVTLKGDLYNGSGLLGGQAGDLLEVNLGKDVTLEGVITSSSIIHSTDGGKTQNSHFTLNEYYKLGHVVNKAFYSGANDVNVSLTDNAAWTVTGTCYLSGLDLGAGVTIAAPSGMTLTVTVDGVETAIAAGSTYTGEIVITVE